MATKECEKCTGTGLQDANTLCPECEGSGTFGKTKAENTRGSAEPNEAAPAEETEKESTVASRTGATRRTKR